MLSVRSILGEGTNERSRCRIERCEYRSDEECQKDQCRVNGVCFTKIRGQAQSNVEQAKQDLNADECRARNNGDANARRTAHGPRKCERAGRGDQRNARRDAMQHLYELARRVNYHVPGALWYR
jgi:hypothetical protein